MGWRSACAVKCASIWSARMRDAAMVINAWRMSWPWFQRRNSWWMTTPTSPLTTMAIRGREHPGRAVLGCLECDVAAEEEQGAMGQVGDAQQSEDQREPARGDEVQAGERQPVEGDQDEDGDVPGVAEALVEGLPAGRPASRVRRG